MTKQEFHQLFYQYYSTLCVFTYGYVHDEALAADIVQECFVVFWNKRSSFDNLHKVKSFLYTTAKNRALNELSHRKVEADYADRLKACFSEQAFHDYVIEKETYNALFSAVSELPPRMQQIINLSLEGLRNPEIAAQLDISVETVRSLKKSAYKKLRLLLKEYYYAVLLLMTYL